MTDKDKILMKAVEQEKHAKIVFKGKIYRLEDVLALINRQQADIERLQRLLKETEAKQIVFAKQCYIDAFKQMAYIAEDKIRQYNAKLVDEEIEPSTDSVTEEMADDNKEVKHGTWIISSDGYYPYCSECGYEPKWTGKDNRTPKCPGCGAKMRKEHEKE